MDNLETLNALLDMTKEAEELASDIEKSERLRSLVVEMRSKAKEERTRLRRDHRIETRYELCVIGILEELTLARCLGKTSSASRQDWAVSVRTSTGPSKK